MSGVSPLETAIRKFVLPGMHLHFASTPSRSNAAVRELGRCFRRSNPRFSISASGFHSTLHLLVRLGLARSYLACFFGDNYPVPRPNRLYQGLEGGLGKTIHVLSLLSYVEALRAGAMAQPFAVTRSLLGTDMGRDLERAGYFFEHVSLDTAADTGASAAATFGLVKAIRPDVTFVHALLADAAGNVVVSAPHSEGFWAANGARRGVIVTVERLATTAELREFRDAMPIARHQVLAVCEVPGGAHPQPVFAEPRFGVAGYEDDFAHYLLWRRLATDDSLFAEFERLVLDAPHGEAGYSAFKRAVADGSFGPQSAPPAAAGPDAAPATLSPDQEALFVAAARAICRKVKAKDYKVVIAGIGGSFYAARLAKIWLARERVDVDVIVETGLAGVACGAEGHDFLLSHRNTARSERLSNVEDALGVLCVAGERCLGVIGAAEVDARGNINSTRSASGQFLVGSGGANDIASRCAEVIVTVRCDARRLVEKVAYVTSPGDRVTEVVTDRCTFSRDHAQATWSVSALISAENGQSRAEVIDEICKRCPWRCTTDTLSDALPISAQERRDLDAIHPVPLPDPSGPEQRS